MLKKITLILTLLCMLVLTATGSNRRFTLVIDPGHGGHDVGARGAISKEKNINLSVAMLARCFRGIKTSVLRV